jgi:oligopeptide/dipeptide ABC transporter ATP-binding protein
MAFLEIQDLKKYFHLKQGMFGKSSILRAVDDVSFNVEKDTIFSVVGESGCGKSTLARMIVRLLDPTGGRIFFENNDIFQMNKEALRKFRRSVQIIFQDPYASLNPRMRVMSMIAEPLKIHKIVPNNDLKDRVAELLASVGLSADMMNKYPHEFSGGQRQRICIARALSLSPDLIVADEPLSALDVSIQAQILNLLKELKGRHGLSFVFISHDLNVVHYFSDNVAVMYLGKIVELADTVDLFAKPLHPYTELLLRSAPKIHSVSDTRKNKAGEGSSDVPSPINIPSGCPFHPRCPKRFEPCDKIIPELTDREGHLVRCLLYE